MELAVTSQALAAMRAHAAAAHPHEACGLLLGEGACITEARAAANVHPAPATHFEIDPQALIDAHRAARAGGLAVLGYYHSHPCGPPDPSATDRASASGDGRVWAIIAGEQVRFWQDGGSTGNGGFVALPFVCRDS
jgi:desampylase